MTSTITMSPTGFAATNSPSSRAPTLLWSRLAATAPLIAKHTTAIADTPGTRLGYKQIRATGEKLLRTVGEAVFRSPWRQWTPNRKPPSGHFGRAVCSGDKPAQRRTKARL